MPLRLAFACVALPAALAAAEPPLRYTVDLNDRVAHEFKVSLRVDSLPASASIFQFAATAPGTYQVMDIGRYVRRFQAFDARGAEIAAQQVSVNQWRFSDPQRVREIRYSISATYTAAVPRDTVYPMCASVLANDHALINGQAVFGFPRGMQGAASSVRLVRPASWIVGTPLRADGDVYFADDYDRLVDSPILAGDLTVARMDVTGVPVEVYAYSPSHVIAANKLLGAMRTMLTSAGTFLGKLPVDRYTFLYDFLKPAIRINGAWEHSFGSEYALNEAPYSDQLGKGVTDMAAHEFFHVVTPLNLHSNIIEHFNFETPVPSHHLWLYEGATEWAAHKMQLESHLKSPAEYLAEVVQKARADRLGFDTTWSLEKIAVASYSDSGQAQYSNVYQRGAIMAGLLDIRLLELSGGAHGLRDLIADLGAAYGKKRSFPDDSLFDIIVARTSPQLRDFFTRYISSAEHPPLREYYGKLGIRLIDDERGLPQRFEIDPNATPAQLRLRAAWLGNTAGAPPAPQPDTVRLRDAGLDRLTLVNASAQNVTYRGRPAVQVLPLPGHESKNEELLAIVDGTDFGDGTIELDVAGAPRADADTSARGFVGLAFHVAAGAAKYESFYIRPTNARSGDQARRNHSTQYISFPDYPWQRLRAESPAKYESYVDLEPGVWTKLRIEVRGTNASLFVNGAAQPALVVHDLKLGVTRGRIALWSFAETDAYFSNLRVGVSQ